MSHKNKKIKALGLNSGGLDSILSALILKKQGIEIMSISFETPFFNADKAIASSKKYNIPIIVEDITEKYLPMLKNPKGGYGKNMNPCKDCHTLMFEMAGKKMVEMGFDFLFSGEVLGQRPMSQTKPSIFYINKNTKFGRHILRPLSAKKLPITEMERDGLVKREMLYDINGKSRKRQIQLAKELNVTNYPAPGGGCLLTDKNFSRRLKDLFKYSADYSKEDLHLLKFGRHFRINERSKLIIGRDEKDNMNIESFFNEKKHILIKLKDYNGPLAILNKESLEDGIKFSVDACFSYFKKAKSSSTLATILIDNKPKNILADKQNISFLNQFII